MQNTWFFVATLEYTDFISLLKAQAHRHQNTKDDSRGSSCKSSRFFQNGVCMWELFTCELDLLVTIFVLDFFQNKVKMTKWFCCYFADILHARPNHGLYHDGSWMNLRISFELTKPNQCTQALLAPWWWSSIFSVNSGFDTEFMEHMKCDISNKDNHMPWNRESAVHFLRKREPFTSLFYWRSVQI